MTERDTTGATVRGARAVEWEACRNLIQLVTLVGTDPAHRGQGFVRLLLEDTVAFIRARGFRVALAAPHREALAALFPRAYPQWVPAPYW